MGYNGLRRAAACMHRRDQNQKDYEERQAERKRRDAEMAGEPFHQQVRAQLHLLQHCRQLL